MNKLSQYQQRHWLQDLHSVEWDVEPLNPTSLYEQATNMRECTTRSGSKRYDRYNCMIVG